MKKILSKLAVPFLGLLAGIQTVDPLISSVALVKASDTLNFSPSVMALAASVSTLALAATVIGSGQVADKIGRRKLLIIALVLAAIGDIIVAVSMSDLTYLLGRIIAGIGLGAVFAASFAYIYTVAKNNLGVALGIFAACNGVVVIILALIGGSLVNIDWRAAYLLVPVLSLLGALGTFILLPKVPKVKGIKYDYWGILLVAIGSVGVLYGITNIAGSLTSVGTWLPIVVGLAAFALFALYESKSKIAIFPMQLFKSPVFISAVLLGLMWNFAQAAVNLQLSNLWQWYLHWSPIEVTIYSLPMSVMIIIFALIAGKSISKGKSLKSRVMIGFAGITLGCLSFAFIPLDQGYLYYLPGILLMGVGLAYSTIAEGKMFIAQAPKSKFGAVTSSKTSIGQFGYSIGLALPVVIMSKLTSTQIVDKLKASGASAQEAAMGAESVASHVNTANITANKIDAQALDFAASSYFSSFHTNMLIISGCIAVLGVVTYLLLSTKNARKIETVIK